MGEKNKKVARKITKFQQTQRLFNLQGFELTLLTGQRLSGQLVSHKNVKIKYNY